MVPRRSIRKKLAYSSLAGALITVILFSLVIKGIIDDYFQRQSAARLTFVKEQGNQAVRTNLAIFKDRIHQLLAAGAVSLNALSRSGVLGDRLQSSRAEATKLLQAVQAESGLSFITVVDVKGTVVLRATNPSVFGDDTLMKGYQHERGPVSSIRNLLETALKGQTTTGFEVFPPEILALENAVEKGKVISSLKEHASIPLQGRNLEPGALETRALTLAMAAPVLNSQGAVVGAVVAGRIVNKDQTIVQDIRNLLQDHATIFLGQVRIATTRQSRSVGTLHGMAERVSGGFYLERREDEIDGEQIMGVFDPIRDHQNVPVGSLYVGRPLSLMDNIAEAQQNIDAAVERRTTLYIILLAIVSVLIAIVIATVFSKRITAQIDQMRKGAETISDGNLDYRLQIRSGDEIQLLAEQFNSMAAKLHESYQTLERKVEERTRELKESQQTMVQQEKMVGIGQLAAGIAHELNTPLGTIIGYSQMLREDLAAQGSVNGNLTDVDEIIEQANRCRDLVKNLLNFSRRSTTEKTQADINGIIRKILSLVEHDFELKRVRIRTILDPALPKATVNENEIAQVVLNLANNGADSMPEGGALDITTTYDATSDSIRIDVHDSGIGISERDRTRVFEPFFTTKDVGKGTGLGLSICYKIVEHHMGSMTFDSVVGQGSTFTVYLPVNAEVKVG